MKIKYYKRIIYPTPHMNPFIYAPIDISESGEWYRGYIYRDIGEEYLEEYIKIKIYKERWGHHFDVGTSPWFKSPYYAKFAGTGKGNAFKEIDEREVFIEVL